jgi:hypothetical protein
VYSIFLRVVIFFLAISCGFLPIAYPEWVQQFQQNYYGYLPIVETTEITSITTSSAQAGGNVTSDGGLEISSRGVCWSVSPSPDTDDDATVDGQGIGSFTSSLTGLSPGTTYHVRAYATNSAGTAYGSDIGFETNPSYNSTLFVSSDGNCGTKTPCFSSIQTAINSASANSVIMVRSGTYEESLILGNSRTIFIKGGYNSTEYNQQLPNTTFINANGSRNIKASSGNLKLQMISVR